MKHYALIFYPSPPLTPEELTQRQFEVLDLAKKGTSMGVYLVPRSFGSPLARLTAFGNDGTGTAFANIVFFDSASEEQAMHVAKTHPGLRYGATIEVREWTPPRAAVPTR